MMDKITHCKLTVFAQLSWLNSSQIFNIQCIPIVKYFDKSTKIKTELIYCEQIQRLRIYCATLLGGGGAISVTMNGGPVLLYGTS